MVQSRPRSTFHHGSDRRNLRDSTSAELPTGSSVANDRAVNLRNDVAASGSLLTKPCAEDRYSVLEKPLTASAKNMAAKTTTISTSNQIGNGHPNQVTLLEKCARASTDKCCASKIT